jgi:hypothetical protein
MNISRFSITRWIALLLVALFVNFSAQPLYLVSAANNSVSQPGEVVIPDGTEFTVETIEEISSKTAAEGDPLTFRVKENVVINGAVVIAKGTFVKGIVSAAKKNGRMGKAGTLSIRVESTIAVDGQKVRLRASKGREGDDKTGTTVALVVLFGPLGFLKKGKDATIKPGTEIKVYTDEQVKVAIAVD